MTPEDQDKAIALVPLLQAAESVQIIVRTAGREQQFDATWLLEVLETALPVLIDGNSIGT